MKVYNDREIRKVLKENGYSIKRYSGDHAIYSNDRNDTISIKVSRMNRMVWQRLVKEHNLKCRF